jgi:hypothetical protein
MKSLLRLLASSFLILVSSLPLAAADLSITGTAVIPSASAVIVTATAGEAITRGQLVYKKASDRKIYKADANSATAEVRDCVGIAVTDSSTGGPIAYVTEDPNLAIAASGLTNGTVYILSATPGGLAPEADATTGWFVTVVGIAKNATTLAFRATGIRSATAL